VRKALRTFQKLNWRAEPKFEAYIIDGVKRPAFALSSYGAAASFFRNASNGGWYRRREANAPQAHKPSAF